MGGEGACFGRQLFRRNNLVDVANAFCFFCGKKVSRVEQAQCARGANQSWQQPTARAGIGHQAAMDEVPGEARAGRGNAHIALG